MKDGGEVVKVCMAVVMDSNYHPVDTLPTLLRAPGSPVCCAEKKADHVAMQPAATSGERRDEVRQCSAERC